MNAISDIIEVKAHKITYSLPPDFDAKRVQIIILPIESKTEKPAKKNRIIGLKRSILGEEGRRLESHLKEIREEW